ncbi:resolvase [Aggregatibacter actinomycetemcomitans RhAA1]|nr:resolvase [Aggregatibacter actinomycetemcomitans RhAA1]
MLKNGRFFIRKQNRFHYIKSSYRHYKTQGSYGYGLFTESERNFIVERTQGGGGELAKIESGDSAAIEGKPKKLSQKRRGI